VNVVNGITGKPMGRVVNVTSDGLMLVSQTPIPPDRQFVLRLVLPRVVGGKWDLEVDARSVWFRPDDNPNYYRIGFEFRNIGGEDAYLLENVMHTFHLAG
jgi:hypothetical protein